MPGFQRTAQGLSRVLRGDRVLRVLCLGIRPKP